MPERFLRVALLVGVMLLFAAVGIAHVVDPDRFLQRSGIRKGGEMLTTVNRLQIRIVNAVLAGFSIYLLYVLLLDLIRGCE